jgi:hypothetical protein
MKKYVINALKMARPKDMGRMSDAPSLYRDVPLPTQKGPVLPESGLIFLKAAEN